MDRVWLEEQLAAGRSIQSIADAVAKDPTTVSYWVRKFDLKSAHAERHAPRGGISREVLEELIAEDLTTREIAERVDRSQSTVRHWLHRYGLSTGRRRLRAEGLLARRSCKVHGEVEFVRYGPKDAFRCRQCRYDAVTRRRRKIKEILVSEAGGRCVDCGYDRFAGALHFHHRDPAEKSFGLALNGAARSLARAREEAAKCDLVCANCHAEREWGLATLPDVSCGE